MGWLNWKKQESHRKARKILTRNTGYVIKSGGCKRKRQKCRRKQKPVYCTSYTMKFSETLAKAAKHFKCGRKRQEIHFYICRPLPLT